MMKTLRYFFVAALAMVVGNAFAADVTDELTWQALGLDGTTNQYKDYSGIKLTSTAVYAGQMSSGGGTNGGKYIQLRTNNNNAGIVTTTTGGKLKSVTITFNAATTDRAIDIYGKNEAYAAATDLYDADKQGTKLATIAANADSKTLTVDGDYTFVGLKSANGAIYVDKIEITWAAEGGSPAAGDYTVGIARPHIGAADSWIYDDFGYNGGELTEADFNKGAAGLDVAFYQTDELKATLVKDEAGTGYGTGRVFYRGTEYNPDYVWKIQCTEGKAANHAEGAAFSEKFTFGFDLKVVAGMTFTVKAIDFDLLIEQNPWWRVRIDNAAGTVYDSGILQNTSSYNNVKGWGMSGHATIGDFTLSNGGGNDSNLQWLGLDVTKLNPLPEGGVALAAGDYKVLIDIDYNNENPKSLSFDNFTLSGTLASATGIENITAGKALKADNVMYNLAGQKVGADYKGLVIMNGKKVVIK